MKKLIPADTVDAEGTVWETIGENIRNGAKAFSENDVKAIIDIMFPIGSWIAGNNSLILSVGKWVVSTHPGSALISGSATTETGEYQNKGVSRIDAGGVVILQLWKRVE